MSFDSAQAQLQTIPSTALQWPWEKSTDKISPGKYFELMIGQVAEVRIRSPRGEARVIGKKHYEGKPVRDAEKHPLIGVQKRAKADWQMERGGQTDDANSLFTPRPETFALPKQLASFLKIAFFPYNRILWIGFLFFFPKILDTIKPILYSVLAFFYGADIYRRDLNRMKFS